MAGHKHKALTPVQRFPLVFPFKAMPKTTRYHA